MKILEDEIVEETDLDKENPDDSNEIINEVNKMADELSENYDVIIE